MLQIWPYLRASLCWGHSVLQTPALVFQDSPSCLDFVLITSGNIEKKKKKETRGLRALTILPDFFSRFTILFRFYIYHIRRLVKIKHKRPKGLNNIVSFFFQDSPFCLDQGSGKPKFFRSRTEI